ncbi:MAG: putative toxin-antitoxin system toxin component, PIN family [Burkholderiales bacterium]|nr:putative toxin-antitoxin system toxin component, PIN family [Burkholderiales bacterium]
MQTADPLRVVLDTNVIVSALLFARGPTAQLRLAWQSGRLLPLVSTTTARELVRVLAYPKFKLTPAEQQELLADYLPWTEVVAIPDPRPTVPDCRDPHDLPFLHLAVAGHAAALVTGDADLLVLAAVRDTIGISGAQSLTFAIWTVQALLEAIGSV